MRIAKSGNNGGRRLRLRLRTPLVVLAAAGVSLGTIAVAIPASAASKAKPVVTVWVDSTRVAQVKAYEKANPGVKVVMTVYNGNANGSGYLQSKISLDNRVGAGWPDVVFSEENNDAASLASPQFNYPAQLDNGTVSKTILNGFAKGTLAGCTVNGKVYCPVSYTHLDVYKRQAHANGSLYVVFGRHAHRLSSTLEVEVSRKLPRNRPYNSFVILEDGCLATKDFGGARPSAVSYTHLDVYKRQISNISVARASRSSLGQSANSSARRTFSLAFRFGIKLKAWNMKPT